MTCSKTTTTTPEELRDHQRRGESRTDLARVRAARDHVWDGVDPDERPLTREELREGIEAYRRQRGRPPGSEKESTTIRFDRDVLDAFRAEGPGWQTRINAALREWLQSRSKS